MIETRYLNSVLTVTVLTSLLLLSSLLVNFTQGSKSNTFQTSPSQSFQSSSVMTTAAAPCTSLPISSIKASGSQSDLSPSNVADGDLSTRWSNFGLNSWIQLDLGKQTTICSIDIAWYRGNVRVNDFVITGSNDGVNFFKMFSGQSSGLTTDFEKYDLNSAKARIIRITITLNSQNNWAGISEVRLFGKPDVAQFTSPSLYSGSSSSPSLSSSPSPSLGPNFKFTAAGDWGCDSKATATIINMQDKDPELILALGDLSYQSSPNCWLDEVQDIQGITRITIGNHDSSEEESPALEKEYLEHFNLAQPFYSFDYKNAHFLMLSSQLKAGKDDAQYDFVNNDLDKASQNKNIEWIIVALHKQLYTSPTKHSAEAGFRDVYHPLFDKYGVDLVLQAHNHNYQRSFPISYNDQNSGSPIITDNEKSEYNDPKGVIYVTAGTGGKSLYSLDSKAPFIVSQAEEYGAFEGRITDGGLKLIGTFFTNDNNEIVDKFTISK